MKPFYFIILIGLFCTATPVLAQQDDELFGIRKVAEVHQGWIIGANGGFDIPGGDMAKEFGLSTRIGPSVLYKTKSNWVFGVKGDYIFGSQVHPDSFMINLKDKYGEFLTESGARVTIPVNERGYMLGLQVGKIVNTSKKNKDAGILFMTSVGFIQHKIQINNPNGVPALNSHDYMKGYDRLTNGLFIEENIAYSYFGRSGLRNFYIGPDVMVGFTQDRRSYLFDIMRADNTQRLDVFFGIRAGWYLCIFKKKSEDVVF